MNAELVIRKECERCGKAFSLKSKYHAKRQRFCGRRCSSHARQPTGQRPETLALFAKVAEISRAIPDRMEQAAAVGLTLPQLYNVRHKAKAAGFDIAPIQNLGQFAVRYSDKFAKIETEMQGPGCDRCGLHGTHECTKKGLIALVQSRMSMWVEPASGAEDAEEAA